MAEVSRFQSPESEKKLPLQFRQSPVIQTNALRRWICWTIGEIKSSQHTISWEVSEV